MEYKEKFEIYLEFVIEDAKRHVKEIIDAYDSDVDHAVNYVVPLALKTITDDDYRYLAETFVEDHDCNVADNDQWDDIIDDFVYCEKVYARPDSEVMKLYEGYKEKWIKDHVDDKYMALAKAQYENRDEDDEDMTFDEYIEEYGFPGGAVYACLDEFIDTDIVSYILENR